MTKFRPILTTLIIIASISAPAFAIDAQNFNKTVLSAPKIASATTNSINKSVTYSNADLKKIADELSGDLSAEQAQILEDLRVLWQAAANRSETIKFAIYKLSDPESNKPKKGLVKKIFAPITGVASMVGIGSGNTIAASSSVLGGGLLGSLLADDKVLNAKLTKVTDADLVILAKEIDDLQQKLVNLYYNYVTSVKVLNYTDKMVKNRFDYCRIATNKYKQNESLAEALYKESLDKQFSARQDMLSARTKLEQFVGNEALSEVEKSLHGTIIN